MKRDSSIGVVFASKGRTSKIGLVDDMVDEIVQRVEVIQEALMIYFQELYFESLMHTLRFGLIERIKSSHPVSMVYVIRKAP